MAAPFFIHLPGHPERGTPEICVLSSLSLSPTMLCGPQNSTWTASLNRTAFLTPSTLSRTVDRRTPFSSRRRRQLLETGGRWLCCYGCAVDMVILGLRYPGNSYSLTIRRPPYSKCGHPKASRWLLLMPWGLLSAWNIIRFRAP